MRKVIVPLLYPAGHVEADHALQAIVVIAAEDDASSQSLADRASPQWLASDRAMGEGPVHRAAATANRPRRSGRRG